MKQWQEGFIRGQDVLVVAPVGSPQQPKECVRVCLCMRARATVSCLVELLWLPKRSTYLRQKCSLANPRPLTAGQFPEHCPQQNSNPKHPILKELWTKYFYIVNQYYLKLIFWFSSLLTSFLSPDIKIWLRLTLVNSRVKLCGILMWKGTDWICFSVFFSSLVMGSQSVVLAFMTVVAL